jgi:hypothetical protein
LQEDLPGSVQFTRFHQTYFPNLGCIGESLVVTHAGAIPGAPPMAKADRFTVEARYWDVLLRRGRVTKLRLDGLYVTIPPRGTYHDAEPDRTRNADTSVVHIGEVRADNAVLEIGRQEGGPLKFEIHSLRLRGFSRDTQFSYEVSFHNPLPPAEISSTGKFGPWNQQDPRSTSVSGVYTLDHADLGVFDDIAGLLSSTGQFSDALGHLQASGKVSVPDFSVKRSEHTEPLSAEYQAVVNGWNGDVVLNKVDAAFLETLVIGSGTIAHQHGHPGKLTSLDLTVQKGRIENVLQMFVKGHRPPMSGPIILKAHAVIRPEGRPFLRQLQLSGDFRISDGRFAKPETQQKVNQLSQRSSAQGSDKNADPPEVASTLAGAVSLNQGTAQFSSLAFEIPNASARMHGTYSLLSTEIDLHGVLEANADFTKVAGGGAKAVLLKPLNAVFKRKPKGARIPVQLTGTYEQPRPGLEIIPKK